VKLKDPPIDSSSGSAKSVKALSVSPRDSLTAANFDVYRFTVASSQIERPQKGGKSEAQARIILFNDNRGREVFEKKLNDLQGWIVGNVYCVCSFKLSDPK